MYWQAFMKVIKIQQDCNGVGKTFINFSLYSDRVLLLRLALLKARVQSVLHYLRYFMVLASVCTKRSCVARLQVLGP